MVEEFINLKQGSMTLMEYSLSNYSTFLANRRDETSRFHIGINEDLEECRCVILHDNMGLSRLMVHDQQLEESQKKRGICDAMSPMTQD